MIKLYYNTHYHLNDGYVIKTLTKLNSNKVIHIERMNINKYNLLMNQKKDYFEQEYLTGLINYTTTQIIQYLCNSVKI